MKIGAIPCGTTPISCFPVFVLGMLQLTTLLNRVLSLPSISIFNHWKSILCLNPDLTGQNPGGSCSS